MNAQHVLKVVFATVAAATFSQAAHADVIDIAPWNSVGSTELPGFGRIDDNLVNGSGLTGIEHDVDVLAMWLSTGTCCGGTLDTDPFVMFDLGAVYTVDSFRVWNYNEIGALSTRGVKDVKITYGVSSPTETVLPGVTQFQQATGAVGDTGEVFNTFTPFSARFIKFDIDSNYGDASTFYGLSEVQFEGTATGPTLIRGVSIESVSSELTLGFDRDADSLVDGSGLHVGGFGTHTSVADGPAGFDNGPMWLNVGTTNCCGGVSNVNSPGPGQDDMPEVTFDLGDIYNVSDMRVWNYNEVNITTRGVNEMEVLVSVDNVTFDSLGTFNLEIAPGREDVDFSETFALNANGVRYVKFDIISGHGGDNGFVGLSEVQFHSSIIPEPSTLVLAALGLLGLLGGCRRRRQAA